MRTNEGFKNAKSNKNDEFYTQLCDIEKELVNYKTHFKGKVVYCNCDNPKYSAFWKYFHTHFTELRLKSLISTYYDTVNRPHKTVYQGGNDEDLTYGVKIDLFENGDFRSQECTSNLSESDIVVTNPPFSLFREFVATMMSYHMKFLIIGNINCITYKSVFPLIQQNKVWLGTGMGRWISGFIVPDTYELYGTETKVNENNERIVATNNCLWLTNLEHEKRNKEIDLISQYNENTYPTYDNLNAIHVSKTKDIPVDWFGKMGVPITFLDKYNPKQFEIVGFRKGNDGKDLRYTLNGETKYPYIRIIIRRKL